VVDDEEQASCIANRFLPGKQATLLLAVETGAAKQAKQMKQKVIIRQSKKNMGVDS